jgi:hypothetical protein
MLIIVLNKYEPMQVKEVYELYPKGRELDRIAGIMKEKYTYEHWDWQHSASVASVLNTPVYGGYIVYKDEAFEGKDEAFEGKDEAIVDGETFGKVQALRNKHLN